MSKPIYHKLLPALREFTIRKLVPLDRVSFGDRGSVMAGVSTAKDYFLFLDIFLLQCAKME